MLMDAFTPTVASSSKYTNDDLASDSPKVIEIIPDSLISFLTTSIVMIPASLSILCTLLLVLLGLACFNSSYSLFSISTHVASKNTL